MTRGLAVAMLALAGVVACSNADATPGAVSVSVSTVSPAPNAEGIARGDTVRLMLVMPTEPALVATRLTLHVGDSTGPMVPGRMVFGDGHRLLMFVPDSLMEPGTRYFAQVWFGVMARRSPSSSGMDSTMMGGSRMSTTGQIPQGAWRMDDGMGWEFTTGS